MQLPPPVMISSHKSTAPPQMSLTRGTLHFDHFATLASNMKMADKIIFCIWALHEVRKWYDSKAYKERNYIDVGQIAQDCQQSSSFIIYSVRH